MRSSVRLKYWFFSHYWWLSSFAATITTLVLVYLKEPLTSIAGAIGAFLSIVYFVQKQKLEEMRLFRDIFKECNLRYDAMNESLVKICESNAVSLEINEAESLIDYFNLCSEEYLYYQRGYVPPEVWETWQLGMQIIISSPRINELWRAEAATNSYYGLQLQPFKSASRL